MLDKDHSVASGRAMKQIAAGSGNKPKPFMRGQKLSRPMRSGNRRVASDEQMAIARTETATKPRRTATKAKKDPKLPRFVEPATLPAGGAAALRRGLGA